MEHTLQIGGHGLRVGGHVSIAGGISKAVERAKNENFAVIQIFASAPQSFSIKPQTKEEIENFNRLYKENNFQGLYFHAIYLLNLGSDKKHLVDLSVKSLIEYLNFGEKINSIGTIFHVGSYGAKETNSAIISKKQEQVVLAIKKVLEATPFGQLLIMENAAGGGGRIGTTLEDLIYLYKSVNSTRLKLCLDTQHLFATGIDVRRKDELGEWLAIFDKEIGIENLLCVHANDSQSDLGSKHDRHENIGEGKIGREGFKNILSQPLLQDKPFILEVPGFTGKGPDKKNVEILKELINVK